LTQSCQAIERGLNLSPRSAQSWRAKKCGAKKLRFVIHVKLFQKLFYFIRKVKPIHIHKPVAAVGLPRTGAGKRAPKQAGYGGEDCLGYGGLAGRHLFLHRVNYGG
jgi:hypothetical protein